MLPAASVARTSNVCEPSASAAVVNGDVQDAKAAASTRHSNVEPASVEVNVNVGVLSLVEPRGPAVIVVSGAVVSTREACSVAGVASMLPAASVARTSNVCAPWASAGVVYGEVQDANAPRRPGTRTSSRASVEVNVNVGVLSLVVTVGPEVMRVSGGDRSSVVPVLQVPAGAEQAQAVEEDRGVQDGSPWSNAEKKTVWRARGDRAWLARSNGVAPS